jgi:4-amino-4-deoxy-L-arabinose transferase-like glycosyltransferase
MRKRFIYFFNEWFPIVTILIIGAYLRLYKISEYLTFLGDEGRDVLVVKRMIVDGKWTLLGPTASVGGFYMGPIYYYFMLPFLWLWRLDPVGPAIMVALVGIATIYLLYKAGCEIFGRKTGIIASLLYAISPLVIAYSRASWNPNIVPFFSLLLYYLCYRLVAKNQWNLVFWIGMIFGIGIQLHYTFLFLFPPVALWLFWHGRTKEYLYWYFIGCVGFILGALPFLGFELRHGFANTRGIMSFIFAGKDTGFSFSHFIYNISDIIFRLFGRLELRIPDVGVLLTFASWQRNLWIVGSWILALLSIGLSYVKMRQVELDINRKKALMLIFLWLICVLFLFGIYKKSVYDYYFGIIFIIPFLLTTVALEFIDAFRRLGRIIASIVICLLVVLNWEGRPFKYQANNQLGQTKLIASAVLDKAGGKPFNFALITGGNSDHAYRYFLEIWGKSPVTIENPAVDPARKTVTDQLLIVCEYPSCEPLGNSLWEIAGFGRAEIVGVWDVSVIKVYKLVHYQEQSK